MIDQTQIYLDLAKKWINEDIESNKARLGVDYSGELGKVLLNYLETGLPDSDKVGALISMVLVGDLESAIEYETGKLPDFTKTKNAIVPVFRIRRANDSEANTQLVQFAAELNRKNNYDIPNKN